MAQSKAIIISLGQVVQLVWTLAYNQKTVVLVMAHTSIPDSMQASGQVSLSEINKNISSRFKKYLIVIIYYFEVLKNQ